jgi:uncharacterized protein (DUF2336 family)
MPELGAPRPKIHDLIALAHEPSSERRRELMRGVTDLFFSADPSGPSELGLFDDVLDKLAGEMEAAVRAELSQRMSEAKAPPRGLMRTLASDESIEVARPILEGSSVLSDEDLIAVARLRGQDHLKAISQRPAISTAVTDAIVARGDDETLGVLLRNQGAELSRRGAETAVDRALENPELHDAVVGRDSLPVDLLNEMYFVVEARLRQQILARNAEVDPAELDRALDAGRKQLAARDGALPADYAAAEAEIRTLLKKKAVTPPVLAGFLRNRETTKFLISLCEMAEIDYHTARRILERRELDALAVVCKAADFDRSLFLTFAVLILDRESNALGRAREYGELYDALTRDVAQRTVRFWRMRRTSRAVAA